MSKNGVMVGFLIWAWRRYRRAKANADSTGKSVCGGLPLGRCVLALACVLAMGLVAAFYGFDQVETSRKPGTTTADKAERPFAQFVHESNDGVVYDLGEGEYLVVMLSATCEHCMGSVELLNEVSGVSGAPPMVGLMMGTAEERDTFIDATGPFFPIFLTDPVEFFRFIGGAPPRLHYVHAGRSLQHWDWLEDAALPEPTDVVEQVDKLRDNR